MRAARQAERRAGIPGSRRLELRRGGMPPNRVEALDVDLGHTADDQRVVWHSTQADLGRAIDAEIRRIGVVVSLRVAEAKVPDERRRSDPGQADRQALRPIVVRPERVVERAFAEAWQRGRPERQRIDETVAPEHRQCLPDLVVDADIELVLPRVGHRRRGVDGRAGDVRIGDQRDDRRPDRIPTIARNLPQPQRVATELRTAGRKRIDDRSGEEARLLRRRRHLAHARNAFLIAQAFVVREPERPVFHYRTAGGPAELIAVALRLRCAERVREEIVRVEIVIAKKLVDASPNRIGS